jgi:sialidase-1
MEPSVAELEDGELVRSLRTQLGGPYLCRSRDGGEIWSTPQPSGLEGPESCACLRRIPGTNDLLLLWNHSPYLPKGDHFGARTPLTTAVSADGGRTWRIVGDLAADPNASYSGLTLLRPGGGPCTSRAASWCVETKCRPAPAASRPISGRT